MGDLPHLLKKASENCLALVLSDALSTGYPLVAGYKFESVYSGPCSLSSHWVGPYKKEERGEMSVSTVKQSRNNANVRECKVFLHEKHSKGGRCFKGMWVQAWRTCNPTHVLVEVFVQLRVLDTF